MGRDDMDRAGTGQAGADQVGGGWTGGDQVGGSWTGTDRKGTGQGGLREGAAKAFRGGQALTLLAVIGAVYFFLRYISPLIAPVLVAVLFVTMFGPFLLKLQKKLHIHRQIGVVLLLLVACAALAAIVWLLFSWIVGSLPKWIASLEGLEQDLGILVYNISHLAGHALGIDGEYLSETLLSYVEQGFGFFQSKAVPGMLAQSLEYMKGIAAFGGFLATFVIATVLLAKDYDEIMNKLLDREEFHVLLEVICGVIRYIATFVKAQLVIMSVIGTLSALALSVAGIEMGALWGLLAGLLDALPFIGTGIVLVPLAAVRLFGGNIWQAVLCLALYACCVLVRELMEPRLIGSRIGVPPIAVLASVYAGIGLFGVWGIVKGPLGFIIVQQICTSLKKRLCKRAEM